MFPSAGCSLGHRFIWDSSGSTEPTVGFSPLCLARQGGWMTAGPGIFGGLVNDQTGEHFGN